MHDYFAQHKARMRGELSKSVLFCPPSISNRHEAERFKTAKVARPLRELHLRFSCVRSSAKPEVADYNKALGSSVLSRLGRVDGPIGIMCLGSIPLGHPSLSRILLFPA